MKRSLLLKTILAFAVLPLLAGCVRREVVYQPAPAATAPPQAEVVTTTPPPPQTEVIPPAPDPTYVWIAGYYNYTPTGWIWIGGHWSPRPRVGAVWVAPHWVWRRHHRVWVGGYWR